MVEFEKQVIVRLDGKRVGIIKHGGGDFRYFAKGSGKGPKFAGVPFDTIEECMEDVVGNDNYSIKGEK